MTHKVISFYGNDLPEIITELQRKVFQLFEIPLVQIPFDNDHENDRHAIAIEKFLRSDETWDSITIFDVDCIPIKKDCIKLALEKINDDNTIYGNAQASNVFDINPYKTPPFIAPSFMSFTRKLWDESICKEFRFTHYPNPDGFTTEVDVAEMFSRENEKQGRKLALCYPTRCYTDYTWKYDGSFGYPEFSYGNGTEYESHTFHNFQIRVPDKQRVFIEYCQNLIKQNANM